MANQYMLPLEEGQRQMLLMALAHLAVERPGFSYALEEMAKPIDNRDQEGGPELMRKFARMHAEAPFDVRIEAAIEKRVRHAIQVREGREK